MGDDAPRWVTSSEAVALWRDLWSGREAARARVRALELTVARLRDREARLSAELDAARSVVPAPADPVERDRAMRAATRWGES